MRDFRSLTLSHEIHRAEWVVPVSSSPIPDGCVLTHKGRVVAAGPFQSVRKNAPSGVRIIDHCRVALIPALVNAHTHLELSALKGQIAFPQPGFREWVSTLFSLRVQMKPESLDEGLSAGEAELLNSGTACCADITNRAPVRVGPSARAEKDVSGRLSECEDQGRILSGSKLCSPERLTFLELLGFNLHSVADAVPIKWPAPGRDSDFIPVPHSVYSVSPAIISESKAWTKAHGLPFSIHVAEHLDEIEFMQSGRGFCRDLLEILGRWESAWKPPGLTPVEYLDRLGALDSRTLLVHAVHMTEADWDLTSKRRCTVVFCGRSNHNLGVGRPSIEKALSHGINSVLGTDSLASNTDLNLFAEACFTLDKHPSIDPRTVLEMITVNPARSLGFEADFGSIGPGTKAIMPAVEIDSPLDESNLAEAIIQSGKEGRWKWVNSLI